MNNQNPWDSKCTFEERNKLLEGLVAKLEEIQQYISTHKIAHDVELGTYTHPKSNLVDKIIFTNSKRLIEEYNKITFQGVFSKKETTLQQNIIQENQYSYIIMKYELDSKKLTKALTQLENYTIYGSVGMRK